MGLRPTLFTCTAHILVLHTYLYYTCTCTTHSTSYIKAVMYILLHVKYNTIHSISLTWYQSHCSNPLVCRSSAVLSSWVSSAAVVVSSTTASTATSVHQRPLPAATSASASPIRPQIASSERNLSDLPFCEILSSSDLSRAPTRRQKFRLGVTRRHAPPRAATRPTR